LSSQSKHLRAAVLSTLVLLTSNLLANGKLSDVSTRLRSLEKHNSQGNFAERALSKKAVSNF